MNKKNMLKNYYKYNAAAAYLIGFEYDKFWYSYLLPVFPEGTVKVDYTRARGKNGRRSKVIRFKPTKEQKEKLMAEYEPFSITNMATRGAIAREHPDWNRGQIFEELMLQLRNFSREEDKSAWYSTPDAYLSGLPIQIKFDLGTLTTEESVIRVKEMGQ